MSWIHRADGKKATQVLLRRNFKKEKIRDPLGTNKKLSTSRDCRSHRVHAECMASVFYAWLIAVPLDVPAC